MSNLKINDGKKIKKQPKQTGNIGLLIQGIIAVLTLVFGIITIMERSFVVLFEGLLAAELIVMGINNQITYKRKFMTAVYIIVGILIGISIIFEVL